MDGIAKPPLKFQRGIFDIGDKHMSRRMGDAKRRFGVHDHCLGRDSAGPEHRRLSGADGDGVTIVRVSQVGDADGFGRTNLNWRAVDAGHARRDGHRCGHLGIWDSRMLTIILPLNTPAGVQGMFVLYIGTLTPSSIWRTGMSASRSADSKEKLHPMRKLTKSFRSSK